MDARAEYAQWIANVVLIAGLVFVGVVLFDLWRDE